MRRLIQFIILTAWFSVSILMMCTQVSADLLDNIQILKIASKDERAIIKMPEEEMKIIKVGDSIGDNGKVIEITKERVVIETGKGYEKETVIIRLENGKQRIERIKKAPDKLPVLLSPQMQK